MWAIELRLECSYFRASAFTRGELMYFFSCVSVPLAQFDVALMPDLVAGVCLVVNGLQEVSVFCARSQVFSWELLRQFGEYTQSDCDLSLVTHIHTWRMRVPSFHVFVRFLFCSRPWLCRWCGLWLLVLCFRKRITASKYNWAQLQAVSGECCVSVVHAGHWTASWCSFLSVLTCSRGECVILFVMFVRCFFFRSCT